MTSPLVKLNEVSKVFVDRATKQQKATVESINLEIQPSEFLSLVGPSGCGKSTLLRIVAGLSAPTTGEIETTLSGKGQANDLACVFQEPTLLPWAKVWENVYLPLRLQRMNRQQAQAAVDESLDLVGLTESASKFPRELSGGMKMRVAIARSLVTKPKLLLMDEPFAALDELTRQHLNDELLDLQRQFGFSVFFITHSIFESVYLSDRILVMSSGPGKISDELNVDLIKPRTEIVRYSEAYGTICSCVSEALVKASADMKPSTGRTS